MLLCGRYRRDDSYLSLLLQFGLRVLRGETMSGLISPKAWVHIALLGLLGCGAPQTPVSPASTPSRSFPPSPTLSSPPPSTRPQPTPTAASCLPPPPGIPGEDAPRLPLDFRDLRWEALAMPGLRLRHLLGSPYPMFPESVSPDGRRLRVVWRWPLDPPLQSGGFLASAELDTEDSDHRWLIQDFRAAGEREVCCWTLPDGRRLKATRTHAGLTRFVFEDDPLARRLEPPEPIDSLVQAQGTVAFALAIRPDLKRDLWRVDLEAWAWEKVSNEEGLWWEFHRARDGSYALAVQEVEPSRRFRLWRIPARMGAPAMRVAELELSLLASDAPLPPSAEIAGGPYWLISLPSEQWGLGLIVNLRTGRVLRPEDLGRSGWRFLDYHLAPDGRWVAIGLVPSSGVQGPEDPNRALYLAPGENLQAGWLREGVRLVGWNVEPPAALLEDLRTRTLWALRLPPAQGTPGVPLPGARLPIASIPEGVVASATGAPARVLWLSWEGQIQAALDLAPFYEKILALMPEVHGGRTKRVWIGAQAIPPRADGRCQWGLIEWPLPSKAAAP